MCGIVGMATAYSNGFASAEAGLFFDMLYFDALRGMDSTGVFGVDKHSNVLIHKEASQAGAFIQTKELSEFKQKMIRNGLFAVGHNRAATRGVIKDENAHPFQVDDKIVLVQNGTWRGDHSKVKDTEVDTEALAHVIAENDDLETALGKIQAAYSLVWFNTQKGTLNLLRNSERPLWLAKTKSKALVWCSEPGFMMLAAARNNIDLDGKPEQLDTHTHVQLTIKGSSWERSDTKVDPFRSYRTTTNSGDVDNDCWPYSGTVTRWTGNTSVVPFHQRSRHECYTPANNSRVERGFAEEAEDNLPEFHIDQPTSLAAHDAVISQINSNITKKHIIELEDAVGGNKESDCSTWHVFGRLVTPDNHPAYNAVVHWFVYNKTQAEIIDYVTAGFYEARLVHCRRHVLANGKNLVAIMATDPVLIQSEEKAAIVH